MLNDARLAALRRRRDTSKRVPCSVLVRFSPFFFVLLFPFVCSFFSFFVPDAREFSKKKRERKRERGETLNSSPLERFYFFSPAQYIINSFSQKRRFLAPHIPWDPSSFPFFFFFYFFVKGWVFKPYKFSSNRVNFCKVCRREETRARE